MSAVAEINETIAKLSPQEYCELMAELYPRLPDNEWDKQMKADAAAGKLDFIDRNVEKARREGALSPTRWLRAQMSSAWGQADPPVSRIAVPPSVPSV